MEEEKMKVKVNEERCIGCGSCVSLTEEEIFDFNEDGKAYAKVEDVPEDKEESVKMAIEYCPTDAIKNMKNENVSTNCTPENE